MGRDLAEAFQLAPRRQHRLRRAASRRRDSQVASCRVAGQLGLRPLGRAGVARSAGSAQPACCFRSFPRWWLVRPA
jgi:hypothetical protein